MGDVQSAYDYTLNENGTLVDYGSSELDYKQDVFTRHAVSVVEQGAPPIAVLPLGLIHGTPQRRT